MENHLTLLGLKRFMRTGFFLLIVFIFSLKSCLDPIEFDQPRGLEDALVIQGLLLKGSPSRVEIRITRLFNFNTSSFGRVTPIEAHIIDQDGNKLELEKRGEGILRLTIPDDHPDFPIKYNRSYRIEFQMPSGGVIVSDLEPLIPVTRIDSIHNEMIIKFVQDPMDRDKSILDTFIRFSVDTQLKLEDQQDYARFRWLADRTFRFTEAPQFEPPTDTCYITQATDLFQPRLFDGNVLKDDYLNRQVVYDQYLDFKFAEGYIFSVYQESLSEGAFAYWDQVDQLLNRTGDMFETPAGIAFSNLRYTDNREEQIYGYFYCTERDTLRKYISPMSIMPRRDTFCTGLSRDGGILPITCFR
ncbi:MAG: DUF4249 family protein, partial [Bacteroidota bacterium]